MDPHHRDVIKSNRENLIANISFDEIKPYLRQFKMFNKYMWEDLKSISDVIDALPSRGPTAFENMITILRKAKYNKEADALEKAKFVEMPGNLYYKMTSKPLGYCLIINNVNFELPEKVRGADAAERDKYRDERDRFGSDEDAKSLREFFESINFNVTVERNLDVKKMEECLKKFSDKDFNKVDSMILIILSHGGQSDNLDFVYGVDEKPLFKHAIYDLFDNKNESLMGKPKLFFFVACRGGKLDYGVKPKTLPMESTDGCTPVYLPTRTDMFVFHSTLPRHASMRDHEKGSYFCQIFVSVLQKYHKTHHLRDMMYLVNQELQLKISVVYRCVQVVHSEDFGGTKNIFLCYRQ